MQSLGVIDIGGTTIKFAVWQDQQLVAKTKVTTPTTLAEFYTLLTTQVAQMKRDYQIAGVGISSPGAVNKATGIIEGASALPYIHNFRIQPELQRRFELPVSMENDANCAALAELADGAGKQVASLCFLIVGTGVGGSVIVNHQIWHGAHLFGGEFGFTLMNDHQILSEVGTAVAVAKRYNASHPAQPELDGQAVFELAAKGDTDAQAEVQVMVRALARAIYNLQYSFDPELIVMGGAVSNNPHLLPATNDEIEKLRATVKIASIKPDVVACHFTDEANLRGAVVDFCQTYLDIQK
ncbi:sugar kinase and transcription regulator [Lactobacillus plantarum JDM1] [Lactiplantibacillus plantarum]|uniref:Bifunctional protein: transcription regulator, sugar kinase, ROK family n=1 Tax=Lactiplantibacillus plantarum CMPG5300 TaxID=1304889 RepID=A0AAW3FKC9_LACPN|nr:ROK family protein [Lactiplantibacillus plantarum]ATI72297.1 ROK family protein [Lactiplantibacillus plantarum]KGH41744.1 bifunctional protein: transcription regulator, sugar kinase, ROK family [Lactiplantibacillus plantarum CMPG5300]MBS0954813.1 ROK family protein [Lactiplantibacillus plantarum]MCZ2137167.1 ROK family protein [Lactiplantibacillus plantarum]MCZ2273668.1 ROK family protein [Lactiplantibacillus plantarum]